MYVLHLPFTMADIRADIRQITSGPSYISFWS
jgi:hypothetical protein